MPSWMRIRRKRTAEPLLPLRRYGSLDIPEFVSPQPPPIAFIRRHTTRRSTSRNSTMMPLEWYLNAPLEDTQDTQLSAPDVLGRQWSVGHGSRPSTMQRGYDTRRSSFETHSGKQQTFVTLGSTKSCMGTSSSQHLRGQAETIVSEHHKLERLGYGHARTNFPGRPSTSGTSDLDSTCVEQIEKVIPGYPADTVMERRARVEEEIANIQQKAKQLEEDIRRYREEQASGDPQAPVVTNEMAFARIAAQPKLAWLLGADVSEATIISRRRERDSLVAVPAEDYPAQRITSGTFGDVKHGNVPRKTKSKSASISSAKQGIAGPKPASYDIFPRKSVKRHTFFCTFCHKQYHSRKEWTEHERIVHMPEELWVCCPRTGEFPERCPFCAKSKPSPAHLADHNYLSCQEKPISERTYSDRDNFLQHILRVHSTSAGQRSERLAELAEAWKNPLSPKAGDQTLHCGFCGRDFLTYKERSEHVGDHFMEGLEPITSWWVGRVSHEIRQGESQNPSLPHKCMYCERIFESLAVAKRLHPLCTMWSCSFLPGMQYSIYPIGTRNNMDAACCYCNETLVKGAGKVKASVLKEHVEGHNFRHCNQRLYFSGQRFRQHLRDSHQANYDGTLSAGWTLLLKSSKKVRPAVYQMTEAVHGMGVRREIGGDGSIASGNDMVQEPHFSFVGLSDSPQRSTAPRKLRRKASTLTLAEISDREVRNTTCFFTRAATIDLAYGATTGPPSPYQEAPRHSSTSPPIDMSSSCPSFYRRRLDTVMRNRLYVRHADEGALSKHSQRLFKKMEESTFGGLVLHSSLVGAAAARMTNSVDVYALH